VAERFLEGGCSLITSLGVMDGMMPIYVVVALNYWSRWSCLLSYIDEDKGRVLYTVLYHDALSVRSFNNTKNIQ
jgi:hypothetical protein